MSDNKDIEEKEYSSTFQKTPTKKIAAAAIFTAIGAVLFSPINPFIHIQILGAKIYPIAHVINAITGVLIGLTFSCLTGFSIAIYRYSFGFGSELAFPGHLAGALVVGLSAYLLRKKKPKYVEFAAFTEPLGTVFIGGTIAFIIAPFLGKTPNWDIVFLLGYWSSWALSSIPGCILGFLILKSVKAAGITWEDFN